MYLCSNYDQREAALEETVAQQKTLKGNVKAAVFVTKVKRKTSNGESVEEDGDGSAALRPEEEMLSRELSAGGAAQVVPHSTRWGMEATVRDRIQLFCWLIVLGNHILL